MGETLVSKRDNGILGIYRIRTIISLRLQAANNFGYIRYSPDVNALQISSFLFFFSPKLKILSRKSDTGLPDYSSRLSILLIFLQLTVVELFRCTILVLRIKIFGFQSLLRFFAYSVRFFVRFLPVTRTNDFSFDEADLLN